MSFRKVILLAFALLLTPHAIAQSDSCLRRTMPVSVVDRNGAPVEGLTASDFRAEFQGKQVKILSVARDDRQHRIVILLDASGSMFGVGGMKWSLACASALHIAQSNLPKASLALLIFRGDIVERIDFPQGTTAVSDKLKQVGEDASYKKNPHGETALFDAILEGLRLLGPSSPGDVIYAITDGGDNKSRNSVREVQRALETAGVRVFALALTHMDSQHANTPEEEYGKSILQQVVDDTGGMQLEPIEITPVQFLRLGEGEKHRIAKALKLLYQEMLRPYEVEIELPQTTEKPSMWRLTLSDKKRREVRGLQVAYPRELMPCTSLTAAN